MIRSHVSKTGIFKWVNEQFRQGKSSSYSSQHYPDQKKCTTLFFFFAVLVSSISEKINRNIKGKDVKDLGLLDNIIQFRGQEQLRSYKTVTNRWKINIR